MDTVNRHVSWDDCSSETVRTVSKVLSIVEINLPQIAIFYNQVHLCATQIDLAVLQTCDNISGCTIKDMCTKQEDIMCGEKIKSKLV